MAAANETLPPADGNAVPGWYGKLASLGDFAQRRLPAAWVQACDGWLSQVMREAAQQLGERWLPLYLTAPVLRFAWAPGVFDAQWWFGVLMPSCDDVGRYYPLLIAQPRARPPADRIALDHLDLWYTHLARAALQTLRERGEPAASVDAFEQALSDAPPWPGSGRGTPLAARAAGAAERFEVPAAAALSEWLPALAAAELRSRVAGCTLWWRAADPGTPASVSLVPRLPDAPAFIDLLGANAA